MRRAYCSLVVFCLTAVCATGVAGQVMPGGVGTAAAKQRNDYLAYVRQEVDVMVERWESAANRGDARALAELYAENATIIAPTGSVFGRDVIRDRFARTLPRMRSVNLRIESFTASGELAHVAGSLTYEVAGSRGGRIYEVALSLVLEQYRQRQWRITTQVGGELPVTVTALPDAPSEVAVGAADTLGVRVTDASGNGVANVLVAFEVEQGRATLTPIAVTTDPRGIAATTVVLGAGDVPVIVRATASALSSDPIVFTIAPGQVAGGSGARSGSGATETRSADH